MQGRKNFKYILKTEKLLTRQEVFPQESCGYVVFILEKHPGHRDLACQYKARSQYTGKLLIFSNYFYSIFVRVDRYTGYIQYTGIYLDTGLAILTI